MISVVLATYNEEENIERCLKSISKVADEVIVVDGSSTDATVAIAKKLGAKVISTTNKPNFHINKQMAMDEASGDLVLQMDADEEIDQSLITFIKKQHQLVSEQDVSQLEPKAWYIKRKNHFLGKWLSKGGQYPDPVIRLYVNGYARLPQKDVHEQMTVDGTTATAQGHILHYPNKTFQNYLTHSFNRYTTLTAQTLYKNRVTPSARTAFSYLFIKPISTFTSLYFRHKGFVDGIPGLIFATFSGLHHAMAYLKLVELYETR